MQGSLIVYFKLALIRYDGCPGPTSLAWPRVQKETEVDAMQRAVPTDDLIGLLWLFVPTPLIGAPCITDWTVIQIYARSRRTYMLEHGFCGSRNG